MTMLSATLLAACAALAQEPEAPPPPAAEAPAESPLTAKILEAIGDVIRSYDAADRDVRSAAEAEVAARPERLTAAEAAVGALLTDMEDLLKLLPAPS